MKALGFLRAKQEWESGNKGINHLKQSESGLCCCTCRTPPRNKWQATPLLERARKAWREWPGSVPLRQSSGERASVGSGQTCFKSQLHHLLAV